jgi:hypothetical protein
MLQGRGAASPLPFRNPFLMGNMTDIPKHITRLTPGQIREYLARSYTAVDGLWFMKTEELSGFDKALEIDELVWRVMPKIQARQLKSFFRAGTGLDSLRLCYSEKLSLDGFDFNVFPAPSIEETGTGKAEGERMLTFRISFCPWVDKLVRSNRGHLAPVIGRRICAAEYAGWAAEFGCGFDFGSGGRLCDGSKECVLEFRAG